MTIDSSQMPNEEGYFGEYGGQRPNHSPTANRNYE